MMGGAYPYPPGASPLPLGEYLLPPWVVGRECLNTSVIHSPIFENLRPSEKSRQPKFQILGPGQQTSPGLAPANNSGARNTNKGGGKDER